LALEDQLHAYLDSLEDLQLSAAVRLAERLSGITPQAWVGLSRQETITAVAQRLAAEVINEIDDGLVAEAMLRTGLIHGRDAVPIGELNVPVSRAQIAEAVATLGRDAQTPGSSLLALQPRTEVARRVASLTNDIEQSLSQPINQIRQLLADAQPRNVAQFEQTLRTIERQVIMPLTGPDRYAEVVGRTTKSLGNDLLLFADQKIKAPEATPEQLAQRADDALYVWVCALVKTCRDCMPRHGQVDTLANWRARGRPRGGWSVCRGRCRCMLVPRFGDGADAPLPPGYTETIQPLRREAMRLVDEGTPRQLTVRVPRQLLEQEAAGLSGKARREAALKEAYADDIRVRRALRMLGQINASTTQGFNPAAGVARGS